MRSYFIASIVTSLLITSTNAAAQNQPPPPQGATPPATGALPPGTAAPPPPPGATPPATGALPPGTAAPPPPPGATPPATGTLPPGTAAPPPPPGATPPATGSTTIPQGSPTAQPYPYPYYPQPYYGQGYPPGWAPRPAPKMKTVWYGWQSIIGVVAGDVLTFTGGVADAGALAYIGIAGHVLSGPIVHWTHGHVGKGFAALGLNVGAPLVGGGLGAVIGGASLGGLYGAIIFGGIGYFLGPILDISILSTEQVPDTTVTVPKGARLLMPTSLNLVPMLDQNRRGLMLVGQF